MPIVLLAMEINKKTAAMNANETSTKKLADTQIYH